MAISFPDTDVQVVSLVDAEEVHLSLPDSVDKALFVLGYSRGRVGQRYRYLDLHIAQFIEESLANLDPNTFPSLVETGER